MVVLWTEEEGNVSRPSAPLRVNRDAEIAGLSRRRMGRGESCELATDYQRLG